MGNVVHTAYEHRRYIRGCKDSEYINDIYIYIDMAQCLVPPSPRHGDGPYMHMNVYKIIIDYTGMCVSICT